MKIAYVLKRYPRYSETFIANEIIAHEAEGLEIEIFSLYPPNDTHFQTLIPDVRAPVHYLLADSLKAIDLWQAVSEASLLFPDFWQRLKVAAGEDGRHVYQAILLSLAIQKKPFAHIHSHFATAATTVARLASVLTDLPYSFTAHAKDIYHENVKHDDLEKKLSDASAVVTVSDFNLQYLRKTYGVAGERVRRIYNGLDLDRFTWSSPKERCHEIIAVGRLVEKKGFSDLIEACRILRNRNQQFRCGIIGEGELEPFLHAEISRLDLGEIVELLGPLPQSEVIKRIARAAVFAAPCVIGTDGNRDGLPTVLLEAMALGTPCVSTDVTGIPEILDDGVTGLMVQQHNPKGLADAIQKLLHHPSLRVELASAARVRIEREFDVRRSTKQLRSLFESCATREVVCE